MARILFIAAHAPTNLYPQAGQKIALKHLEDYIQAGDTVDVLVIANAEELRAATDLSALPLASLERYPLSGVSKIWGCLAQFQLPLKFATRYQQSARQRLAQLLQTYRYDMIHFEYSHAAVYLNFVKSRIDPQQTRLVISVHDVITQSLLRKAAANLLLGLEAARVFQYERELYRAADQVWVLSRKDSQLLTALYGIPEQKIRVQVPQLSPFIAQIQRSPQKIEPKSLLFWAAMNRPENEQAILTFVDQCWKPLLKTDPEFKLYVVGSNPSKKVQALAGAQIIVTGFVPDPTPFFESAAVGIVPLLTGAGIKLKTLEMLAAGLPVIATTVGAEGVDLSDQPLYISDNFQDWPNLLQKLARELSVPIQTDVPGLVR